MSEKASPRYLGTTLKQWQKRLRSRDPIDRRLAAYALGQLGSEAKEATDDLVKALEDKASYVRVWAGASLALIDPGNDQAINTLIDGMKAEESFVRSLSAWHLSRLHCDEADIHRAVPELEKLLEDKDPSVKVEAELAWKRIHSRAHLTH